MPLTFSQLDQSVADLFAEVSIRLISGETSAVAVFQDKPFPQVIEERQFPAINVMLMDAEPEVFETEDERVVSVDSGVSPHISTMRRDPAWFRVVYRIHTFTLSASEDRAMTRALGNILGKRARLVHNDEDYWLFTQGFGRFDIDSGDGMIYHRVWTSEALACIDEDDTNDTTVPQVTSIRGEFYRVLRTPQEANTVPGSVIDTPVDEDGNPAPAADAVSARDDTLEWNQTDYWLPET